MNWNEHSVRYSCLFESSSGAWRSGISAVARSGRYLTFDMSIRIILVPSWRVVIWKSFQSRFATILNVWPWADWYWLSETPYWLISGPGGDSFAIGKLESAEVRSGLTSAVLFEEPKRKPERRNVSVFLSVSAPLAMFVLFVEM